MGLDISWDSEAFLRAGIAEKEMENKANDLAVESAWNKRGDWT